MIRYIERESIQRIYRIGLARSGCLGRLRGQGLRHKAVISGLDYGGGGGQFCAISRRIIELI
jgi:hypothetical protein